MCEYVGMRYHFGPPTISNKKMDSWEKVYAGFENCIKQLESEGFHQTQRPHRKLPALMGYWEKRMKGSGYPVKWYSKKIKGRRTVVRAVVGGYVSSYVDGTTNANHPIMIYCVNIFGDREIEEYEKNH